MPAHHPKPQNVKLHRSYSVPELAACLSVHKNTIRHWQNFGLHPIDASRPVLFQGGVVRAFLAKRNAGRKQPCAPGTIYCFRCRQPRPPALGMVDYLVRTPTSGNLRAICSVCETIMHRRATSAALASIMPGIDVQFAQAVERLKGSPSPSLNCDSERQVTR